MVCKTKPWSREILQGQDIYFRNMYQVYKLVFGDNLVGKSIHNFETKGLILKGSCIASISDIFLRQIIMWSNDYKVKALENELCFAIHLFYLLSIKVFKMSGKYQSSESSKKNFQGISWMFNCPVTLLFTVCAPHLWIYPSPILHLFCSWRWKF